VKVANHLKANSSSGDDILWKIKSVYNWLHENKDEVSLKSRELNSHFKSRHNGKNNIAGQPI
jgi:hypothetical protein